MAEPQRTSQLAREALHQVGISAIRLTLLKAAPDTVYRVQTAKGVFVLRIRKQPLDPQVVKLQARLLEALCAAGIEAPQVVHAALSVPGHQAALYTWIDGRRARDARGFVTPAKLRAVGTATARLHRAAEAFRPRWPRNVKRLDEDHFFGDQTSVGARGRRVMGKRDHDFVRGFAHDLRDRMHDLGRSPKHCGLLHGDLEPPNWIFHRGQARPIDFEFLALGHYLFDLAQILWTHLMWPKYDAYFATLMESYERVRPLSAKERKHLFPLQALPLLDWINRKMNSPAELKRWLRPTLELMRQAAETCA